MKLKELISSGRMFPRAGQSWQTEDRLATLGWISMAVVVVVALLAASYAAI